MPIREITIEELPDSVKQSLQKNSKDLSAKEVLFKAAENLAPSAIQFGEDLIQPFLHPIQTAKDIGTLGLGIYELFVPGEQPNEEVARAVGEYFAQRYGGLENIKQTFATDPVGFMADATIIFTGGGAAISKIGKIADSKSLEKVGNVAIDISQKLDPALLPLKAIRTTGSLTKAIAGTTTQVSDVPISIAFKSGKSSVSLNPQSRQKALDFKKSMSGGVDAESIVEDARQALSVIGERKKQAYRTGMSQLPSGDTRIDFSRVEKIIDDVEKTFTTEGELILNNQAKNVLKEIKDDVSRFKENPRLHTVRGLDALKRLIDKKYNPKTDPTDIDAVVAQTRGEIRKYIGEKSPEYINVMDEFSKTENARQRIQQSLSLGRRAALDTAARKLQSAISETTGTGIRSKALEDISKISGSNLMERLSGQALSTIQPRGLQQITQPISFMAASGAQKPSLLALLAAQTPRLVGEASYRAGQASTVGSPIMRSLPYTRLFEATQQEEDPMQKLLRSLN